MVIFKNSQKLLNFSLGGRSAVFDSEEVDKKDGYNNKQKKHQAKYHSATWFAEKVTAAIKFSAWPLHLFV